MLAQRKVLKGKFSQKRIMGLGKGDVYINTI
jgi:hypothetical protein